jgi:hypothetical protein
VHSELDEELSQEQDLEPDSELEDEEQSQSSVVVLAVLCLSHLPFLHDLQGIMDISLILDTDKK